MVVYTTGDVGTHPTFTAKALEPPADFGALKDLEGTWINTDKTRKGLHTTCLPSPGTTSETLPGIFTFLCKDYTEELTFTLVDAPVRNRGGTNEQIIGAVKYNQEIKTVDGPIHTENGMYLFLGAMYNHPADAESIKADVGGAQLKPGDGSNGPNFVPFYPIARSGTIPHGSTIQLYGTTSQETGAPPFPTGIKTWDFDHLAISKSMGSAGDVPINLDQPPPEWVFDTSLPTKEPFGNKTYTQRILANSLYPYSARPDLRLRDTIKDQNITKYTFIDMDTRFTKGPQGGVLNTPMVKKYTPVTRMQHHMWIETVEEDGKEILQLQYEQIVQFEFAFGSDGGVTLWPHIQVNTLRKKEGS